MLVFWNLQSLGVLMKKYLFLFLSLIYLSCSDPVDSDSAESFLFVEVNKSYSSISVSPGDTTSHLCIDGLLCYTYNRESNSLIIYNSVKQNNSNNFMVGSKSNWSGDAFDGSAEVLSFSNGDVYEDSIEAGNYFPFKITKLKNDIISVVYNDTLQFNLAPGETWNVEENYRMEQSPGLFDVTLKFVINNHGRIPGKNIIYPENN
jgi:hypothetical protein